MHLGLMIIIATSSDAIVFRPLTGVSAYIIGVFKSGKYINAFETKIDNVCDSILKTERGHIHV